MSGANVNFGPLWRESGFLRGAGKWMKTSEAVVFARLLRSAPSAFLVSDRDGRGLKACLTLWVSGVCRGAAPQVRTLAIYAL